VLQRVMADENRYAIGTMVFSGREQVVALRPVDRLLAVSFLSFADQIKSPAAFLDELPETEVPAKEFELARGLVEASTTKHFDLSAYKDQYSGKILKLIEKRAADRGIKQSPDAEGAPAIINLMDALRQSLKQVQRPAKRARPSTSGVKTRGRKSARRVVHGKAG
jgi:DNA end-binding protein Ku